MHVLTTAENRFIIRVFLGSLAQLVEQRTFNPLGRSSNLVCPTTQHRVNAGKPAI